MVVTLFIENLSGGSGKA